MELLRLNKQLEFENQEDRINKTVEMNKLRSKAKKQAKPQKCIYCNSENPQFCNSHSLPAFILRSISSSGIIYNFFKYLATNTEKEENGINATGTFHLICRDCDGKIFRDYENPLNYESGITQKMLAQIAMKCHLRQIYKKTTSIKMFQEASIPIHNPLTTELFGSINIFDNQIDTLTRDINESMASFKRSSKFANKMLRDEYACFYYKKLDYTTPIGIQDCIALPLDLIGNKINDIYNYEKNYKIKMVYICVFPMEKSTEVFAFIEKENLPRYRSFIKQFNIKSENDKLSIINYISFLCSEEVYTSDAIDAIILNNPELKSTAQLTPVAIKDDNENISVDNFKKEYNLSNHLQIPNVLSAKYRL